jgi:hypothetical protein
VFESARHFLFESRTNVFLSAKAETAAETRHVFHRRYKTVKNFPKRLLGILNESALTIRIAAIVLVYKL